MFLVDDYYWSLIKEISEKSKTRLLDEEKYSAGAIGFLYALDAYTSEYGQEYPFLEDMVLQAILIEKKKINKYKRIDSNFSFDKTYLDNTRDCHSLIIDKTMCTEDDAIFRCFLSELPIRERCTAKLLSQGATYTDICYMLDLSRNELNDIVSSIGREYYQYYL